MKALALAAVLLVAACSTEPPVRAGVVTGHEYDDPDDYWVPGFTIPGSESCSGTDTFRNCTRSPDIVIPGHWEHEDARWLLHLRGDPDEKGKVRDGTVEVDRETYHDVLDGQHYDHATGKATSR